MIIYKYNSYSILSECTKEQYNDIWEMLSYEDPNMKYLKRNNPRLMRADIRKHLFNNKTKKFPTGLIFKIQELYPNVYIIDKRIKPAKNLYLILNKQVDKLRSYQIDCVNLLSNFNGLDTFVICTGGGKTLLSIYIAKEVGVNTLFVVPNLELLEQTYQIYTYAFSNQFVGRIGDNKIKPIMIANIQSLEKQTQEFYDNFQMLILDECFVGITKIITEDGVKTLKNIIDMNYTGKVLSYNESLNIFEYKSIINKFRKKAPNKLIKISKSNQICEFCTHNHLFLTDSGWKRADKLQLSDLIISKPNINDHINNIYENYSYISIKKIEEIDNTNKSFIDSHQSRYVYDIEVEDNHNFVLNSGMVVHNCQHSSALTYVNLNKKMWDHIYYRIMLTGTLYRNDGSDLEMLGITGRQLYEYPVIKAIKDGFLAKPEFYIIKIKNGFNTSSLMSNFHEIYTEFIVHNELRNEIISSLAQDIINEGQNVIILVEMIEHGDILHKKLNGSTYIHGRTKNNKKVIEDFNLGNIKLLIASSILSEGVDLPGAENLIIASGYKAKSEKVQQVGRVLRKTNKKEIARIYDFYDKDVAMLERHSSKRINYYKEFGTDIIFID